MRKLLLLLVLAVLSFAARAQVVNVKNTYPCTVQVTFYAMTPNCQVIAISNPPLNVAPGAVVPVNLGNPAIWGGIAPPPGSIFGAMVCIVCPGAPPVTQCIGKVGCPPCFPASIGPIQTCCSTMPVFADWICTAAPMQLNIHP